MVGVRDSATASETHIALIDTAGTIVVPFDRFERIDDFSGGYAFVQMKGSRTDKEKLGVINRNGELVEMDTYND